MRDENPIRILGDYSKPSHKGYRNTIKLPAGNTWTAKLRNDILMFQQHHGESLSEAWTHSKDLLRKVLHHGRGLKKLRPDKAWATIERLTQYEDEGWNDALTPDEVNLNFKNPDIEQLLGVMERKVDALMTEAISLMEKSKNVF
ncbi:hypothetical protein Tco_0348891 [Tanacetum coccineum]